MRAIESSDSEKITAYLRWARLNKQEADEIKETINTVSWLRFADRDEKGRNAGGDTNSVFNVEILGQCQLGIKEPSAVSSYGLNPGVTRALGVQTTVNTLKSKRCRWWDVRPQCDQERSKIRHLQ